jgi:hypothetical protein
MWRRRSAIVAFCLLGVFAPTASAQVAVSPPTSVPAVAATAGVSAEVPGFAASLRASAATTGDASRPPSAGGTATARAPSVDVAGGSTIGSDGARASLDVSISTGSPSPPPRAAQPAAASERGRGGSQAPSAPSRAATEPPSAVGKVSAQRGDGPAGSTAVAARDRPAGVSTSRRTQVDDERQLMGAGGDAGPNTGEGTPDEAASSAGGASSSAALLALVAVLVPLAGWVLAHAGEGFQRGSFFSFLERPG